MATQVQLRRGTAAQNDAFTGAVGEVTYDSDNDTLRVHDGGVAGGYVVTTNTGTQTLTNKTLTSPTINGGSMTGNLSFGDNDKAVFGAGSDLQIYHDGLNSYISDTGTGRLNIQSGTSILIEGANGDNFFSAEENGAAAVYYDNSLKLITTSTGIDVTGTVVSDKLQVTNATGGSTSSNYAVIEGSTVDNSNYPGIQLKGGTFATTYPELKLGNGGLALNISNGYSVSYPQRAEIGASNSGIALRTSTTGTALNRFLAASNGDISFYEDTGTTPKFFWDASAESLGIGTTSIPYITTNRSVLAINGTTDSLFALQRGGGNNFYIHNNSTQTGFSNTAALPLTFITNGSERMRIDSSGRVGIGTSSPLRSLHVSSAGDTGIMLQTTNANTDAEIWEIQAGADGSNNANLIFRSRTNAGTGGSEAMRIDSSGNLLVGKTASDTATAGTTVFSSGYLATTVAQGTANSGSVAQFRRNTTDGSIVNFLKDGSTVGSIGALAGHLGIAEGNTGLRFEGDTQRIIPANSTYGTRDGLIDLGYSAGRFKDLYLSGGVYLGGTGAANYLDDYEEGTWTPVDTSGAGLTFVIALGYYTKIGGMVFAQLQVEYPSTADGTNSRIGGLPFTSASNASGRMAFVSYSNRTDFFTAVADPNSTFIEPRKGTGSNRLTNAELSTSTSFITVAYST